MAELNEKLAYVLQTKNKIKEVLENKTGENPGDYFEDYPDIINNLTDIPEHEEGEVVYLSDFDGDGEEEFNILDSEYKVITTNSVIDLHNINSFNNNAPTIALYCAGSGTTGLAYTDISKFGSYLLNYTEDRMTSGRLSNYGDYIVKTDLYNSSTHYINITTGTFSLGDYWYTDGNYNNSIKLATTGQYWTGSSWDHISDGEYWAGGGTNSASDGTYYYNGSWNILSGQNIALYCSTNQSNYIDTITFPSNEWSNSSTVALYSDGSGAMRTATLSNSGSYLLWARGGTTTGTLTTKNYWIGSSSNLFGTASDGLYYKDGWNTLNTNSAIYYEKNSSTYSLNTITFPIGQYDTTAIALYSSGSMGLNTTTFTNVGDYLIKTNSLPFMETGTLNKLNYWNGTSFSTGSSNTYCNGTQFTSANNDQCLYYKDGFKELDNNSFFIKILEDYDEIYLKYDGDLEAISNAGWTEYTDSSSEMMEQYWRKVKNCSISSVKAIKKTDGTIEIQDGDGISLFTISTSNITEESAS